MKKRLLITSIVMMLVVAVALSTATYAWFTSNANVSATAVVLTAATADGDAIMISHAADNTGIKSFIDLTAMATGGRLYPATPKENSAFTTDLDLAISEEDPITESLDEAFQNLIMKGAGTYIDPAIESPNVSYYTDTFYVYNKGTVAKALVPTVTINYTPSSESVLAAKSVRIALIERVGTEATGGANITFTGNFALRGIYQYNNEVITAATAVDAENDDFSATNIYCTRSGAGTDESPYTYAAANVTSDNFDELKATLFVATNLKSIAQIGANSGYGVVAGANSTYTQGSISFSPNTTFATIAVPSSGHYVANEYTVVMWLEGWDDDCTNSITQGVFSVGLDFVTAS